MKKYSNNNFTELSKLAYQNSYNVKDKNYKKNDELINGTNHQIDKSKIIYNLQLENDQLKERISFVIEKDREISKLKIDIEKYKNIIGKYNIDTNELDLLKNKNNEIILSNEKLKKQVEEKNKIIKKMGEKIILSVKNINILKHKLIEELNKNKSNNI